MTIIRTSRRMARGLGSYGSTGAYAAWTQNVRAVLQSLWGDAWQTHGAAAVIPSNVPGPMQQYAGQPAAMFDNATYTSLYNSGAIDPNRPQVASNNGQVVFVLASQDVIDDAPQTMTTLQQMANAAFTAGDTAATAAGLPSLQSIEDFIKGMGRDVLVGVGVTLVAGWFLTRRGRR